MAARKHHIAKSPSIRPPAPSLQAIGEAGVHEPVESPALLLQNVLREAGYGEPPLVNRQRIARIALIASLAAAYALAILTMNGHLVA